MTQKENRDLKSSNTTQNKPNPLIDLETQNDKDYNDNILI